LALQSSDYELTCIVGIIRETEVDIYGFITTRYLFYALFYHISFSSDQLNKQRHSSVISWRDRIS